MIKSIGCHRLTNTIPIVFAEIGDPVGSGLIASLARPGGNITGFQGFEPAMGGKWLGILKEAAPNLSRVAVLFGPDSAANVAFLRAAEAVAPSLGVTVTAVDIHDGGEIEGAIAAFASQPDGGLIVMPHANVSANRALIVILAAGHHLPAIYPFRYFATEGGLLSYGPDQTDDWRGAATYVGRILRGEKPGDLPVQAPTKSRFVALHCPEYIDWSGELRSIPFKKPSQRPVAYLEKPEMDGLLNAPDQGTAQGRRDYVLSLFLYNTGARADEAAQLLIGDLDLAVRAQDYSSVSIRGKGNKLRHCPLWPQTVKQLKALIGRRAPSERVFLNRRQQPITRFGIYQMVERYAMHVAKHIPSLAAKRVSPHSIRHTTGNHLLRAGVDINTICAWLGHVSLITINIYAEVNLEMKAKAIAHREVKGPKGIRHWRDDPGLMSFLRSL